MSGHSKWSTIKRKKEKTDGQKGKIFTKMGRELAVAVKEGGADPNSNGKLRDLIAKAKANNLPNDNIDRVIKKAASDGDKNNYEDIKYEGYGPNGVAVIVETLTDNRNRTAGDLRHYFDKCGGNLGQSGSVGFMFTQKGVITLEDTDLTEDKLMELCFEIGAEDFSLEDDAAYIYTDPTQVMQVASELEKTGIKPSLSQVEYLPDTYTKITDEEQIAKMFRLIDLLEDNDDVQEVWHNWEAPDEE